MGGPLHHRTRSIEDGNWAILVQGYRHATGATIRALRSNRERSIVCVFCVKGCWSHPHCRINAGRADIREARREEPHPDGIW